METGAISVLVSVYCRLRGHGRAGSRCAYATRERCMQPSRGIEQVLYALTTLLEHKPNGEQGLYVLDLASTRVASGDRVPSHRVFPPAWTSRVEKNRPKRELSMQHFETPPFPADYSGEAVRALDQGWTQTEWIEKQVGAEKVRKQTARFGGGRIDWTPSSAKVRRGRCDVRSSGDRVVVRDDALNLYTLDDDFQHVPTRDILEDAAPSRDDVAALFGRVDVSSHVTKELLDKLKNESDKGEWKERSEALDKIQAICERAGCAIAFTHPVQDVVRLLKARLSYANANIKVKAANLLATIATSVGPEIAKMFEAARTEFNCWHCRQQKGHESRDTSLATSVGAS
ncbi:hypothetical protein PsorP6_006817 [Peronosclerospora sorghi]|uniref:Uncharacterized protein n=1 Tax=Peronosclerospora sorghi TaxID=230839 RepID=A0ACC0WA82_9STRA|nr:hypothetical protein PsorP6_006817 [Peronosclerospora sorghi]